MAEELQISDFDYHLPEELIAQEPCPRREEARLLVLDRATQSIAHHHIIDLPKLLRSRDLLIFNDTRVLPARIYGIRDKTGGKWEGLYLKEHQSTSSWEFLATTRGYIHEGEWIILLDRHHQQSPYRLQVVGRTPERHLLARIDPPVAPLHLFEQIGHIPLPHYIRHGIDNDSDRERYQTVFAQSAGSVAAPTAGLHFTPELLMILKEKQIDQAFVTLHVGIGTFQPIKVEKLRNHVMHQEWCQIPRETAHALKCCMGRRIAVGTTTVRTLESAALSLPEMGPWQGSTSLFIQPGHQFRAIDGLLTNFHLPRSSLLVLISAFAGRALIRQAYDEAVRLRYRFFSYGDAMLIL